MWCARNVILADPRSFRSAVPWHRNGPDISKADESAGHAHGLGTRSAMRRQPPPAAPCRGAAHGVTFPVLRISAGRIRTIFRDPNKHAHRSRWVTLRRDACPRTSGPVLILPVHVICFRKRPVCHGRGRQARSPCCYDSVCNGYEFRPASRRAMSAATGGRRPVPGVAAHGGSCHRESVPLQAESIRSTGGRTCTAAQGSRGTPEL